MQRRLILAGILLLLSVFSFQCFSARIQRQMSTMCGSLWVLRYSGKKKPKLLISLYLYLGRYLELLRAAVSSAVSVEHDLSWQPSYLEVVLCTVYVSTAHTNAACDKHDETGSYMTHFYQKCTSPLIQCCKIQNGLIIKFTDISNIYKQPLWEEKLLQGLSLCKCFMVGKIGSYYSFVILFIN